MGCSDWCRREFHPRNFGFGHSSPQLTVSSQWDGIPPVLYLVWRCFAAIYHTTWLVVSIAAATVYTAGRYTWVSYLTNWTYFLLTFDTVVEAMATFIWFFYQRNHRNPVPEKTTWYMKFAWMMHAMASNTTLLIGLVFWIVIFRTKSPDFYIDVQTHGITILYVVLNLAITAMPVRIYHLIYSMSFGILYAVFTLVYYNVGGVNKGGHVYIYKDILDWSDVGTTMMWVCILLLAGLPILHVLLVYLGYLLRVLIYNRCCGNRKHRVNHENAEESELEKIDKNNINTYDGT